MNNRSYKSYIEEDQEEGPVYTPYQALVFLIDCSPSMHLKKNGQSFFEICLNATIETIQAKISQKSKDQVAVLFYGTKQSKSLKGAMSSHQGIYIATEMNYLDLEDTIKLANYKNKDYYEKEVGSFDQVHLGNVFWAASQLLSGKKHIQRSKKVFMMTNNSDPSRNDQDACSMAATRYKDLQENDISFFFLPLTGSVDIESFYHKYLDEDILEDVKIYEKCDELIKAISTFESRARTVFKVPFILGSGLVCGIKGCYKIIESKKPSPCYLEENTNQEVEIMTTYHNAETGGILKKEEILYSFEYGGVKAVFSKDEIQQMKYFGDSRLVLLGFYPLSWLKLKYNLKHSVFLFPNEEAYIGSSCLLSNMADVMREKNVLAVAALVSSPRATPRFLAMLPSVPLTEDERETFGIGFHGIYLPYKEDVRSVDSTMAPVGKVAATEVTSSMKSIVESLTLPDFSVTSYSNPELSLFYSGLISMAQELDEMEQVNDDTRPNLDWINRQAGSFIKSCNKSLQSMGLDHPRPEMQDDARSAKKLKKVLEMSDLHAGKLDKFTVDQLTDAGSRILGMKNLPKNKKHLIAALQKNLK